jgi:hypothetical protein
MHIHEIRGAALAAFLRAAGRIRVTLEVQLAEQPIRLIRVWLGSRFLGYAMYVCMHGRHGVELSHQLA